MKLKVVTFLLILVTGLMGQHRGVWVVRHSLTTTEDLQTLSRIHQTLQLTDLYVQVRALGKNFLDNEKSSVGLPQIAQFCKLNGIRLHAWINVLYIGKTNDRGEINSYLVNQTPEKELNYGEIRKRGVEGYFVDSDEPLNNLQIKQLIQKLLVDYQVDGIHLDYFRYPPTPLYFSDHLRTRFMRDYFVDPMPYFREGNIAYSEKKFVRQQYQKFRMDILNARLQQITEFVHRIAPKAIVSVAVKPSVTEATNVYGQAWSLWIKKDWCDYVIIMNYAADDKEFKKNLKMAKLLQERDRIVCGIGAYYLDEVELSRRIVLSEKSGLKGFALFSFSTLKKQPGILSLVSAETN